MASSPRATILLLAALFHSTTAQFSAQLSSTNVGPFGLAFTSEKAASQTLSCEGLRGRPFVTGLHVQQLGQQHKSKSEVRIVMQSNDAKANKRRKDRYRGVDRIVV